MSNINHIAIIMDGNGRWGLKKNNSKYLDIKRVLKQYKKLLMHQ